MAKIVIETFMSEKLKLNGNNLVMFAIMWADVQGQRKKAVPYDYKRFAQMMAVSIPTVYNTFEKLASLGLVELKDSTHYQLTETWGEDLKMFKSSARIEAI